MGRFKTITPIFLAVILALLATVVIYRWVQTKAAAPASPVAKESSVPIALASSDLPWGTKLTAGCVKSVPFPKDALPPGHFTDLSVLEGRVLVSPVKQNETILECKLAPTDISTGGVCAIVTPGKRAIAVAGDKVIGLAGFIQPGNRVDVLCTLKSSQNEQESITKVVLEDIPVLATGTQIQNNADGKPAPVDVFTLEVGPEEAEKLSLTATHGKLHFALRNVLDKDVVYTMGTTIPAALDSYRPRMEPVREPVVKKAAEIREEPRRAREVQ
ncbi:MAG: Flp pilus assembly protein CpaB, partial [Syntrophobacter sp.]